MIDLINDSLASRLSASLNNDDQDELIICHNQLEQKQQQSISSKLTSHRRKSMSSSRILSHQAVVMDNKSQNVVTFIDRSYETSPRRGRRRRRRRTRTSMDEFVQSNNFNHKLSVVITNLIVIIFCTLLPLVASSSYGGFGSSQSMVMMKQQQVMSSAFHQQPQDSSSNSASFSCGKLYYRTLYLDQLRNVLYVGAMDNVFRLNLANVNRTSCLDDAISLEPTDPAKCIAKGRSENYECRNHIKVIQPMSKQADRLYVCGTNGYNPRDYLLHGSNLSLSGDLVFGVGAGPAQAECPFDPDDNSTALWVERGNPADAPALYTGTVTDSNRADPLIFRTELYNQSTGQKLADAKRTTKFDSKWLDKPNFIGSFDIGDYVYFFLRESAVEYINCGKSIYSRVARVCKRDNGYKPTMYEKVWTSFSKARLNCSIPGEFPFYFDEIQSITRNPYDERKFHAVFTTNSNGLAGSAICSFTLDAIQDAFNGKFKEQQSSASAWLPVSAQLAPKVNHSDPRPGTCVDDTHALSENLVTFIRSHPLMDSAVANDNGRPVFYRRDVMFTKIVVDIMQIDGITYTVYFAGTNTGHVYKIVEWTPLAPTGGSLNENQQQQQQQEGPAASQAPHAAQSQLVEVIEATVPEPVRAMELSSRFKSLYVASDSQVKQIHLLNCKQRHESCVQCVRDPYCGWDRKHAECRHYSPNDPSALIQDVTNEVPSLCHTHIKHKDVHVTWGQSVHLPCQFNGFIQESQDLQQLLASQARHSQPAVAAVASQTTTTVNNNNNNNLLYQQRTPASMSFTGQPQDGAAGQAHGIIQPAQYIQWYFHRREQPHGPGVSVTQRRDKFILAADQGLVIMSSNESGLFQCRLGNQVIHSYNLIVDTKTCAAPNESEFKRIYADWCREMEQYKLLQKNWHAKQNRCQAAINQQQQHLQVQQHHQPHELQFLAQNYQQQQHQIARHQDIWTPSG